MRINKLIASIAICCTIMVSACAHTIPVDSSPSPVTVDLQWDCSPKPEALPDDEHLVHMKSYELFMRYKDAWQWGDRCSRLLQLNKQASADEAARRQDPSPPAQKPLH